MNVTVDIDRTPEEARRFTGFGICAAAAPE